MLNCSRGVRVLHHIQLNDWTINLVLISHSRVADVHAHMPAMIITNLKVSYERSDDPEEAYLDATSIANASM